MGCRLRVWPRSVPDGLGMSFMLAVVPVGYWFHLSVVLPTHYPMEPGLLALHHLISNFLALNVIGNYLLVLLVDTRPTGTYRHASARFCQPCNALTPPRSWHCQECGSCILRRDHHCLLTACCIGLQNYRYFYALLFYLTASCLYGSYFNLRYLLRVTPWSWLGLIRVAVPALAPLFFPEPVHIQIYRTLCMVTLGLAVISSFTFARFTYNLVGGVTMAECRKKLNPHPERSLSENLRHALGERWYLVLLCPFLPSPIPQELDHSTTFSEKY